MRCFQNIAKLIRTKRLGHPKNYSQSELSNLLGYKNGQFISNVERALCNIPLKMLRRVSEILEIPAEDLKIAILKDHEFTLNRYLYGPLKQRSVGEKLIDDGDDFDTDSPYSKDKSLGGLLPTPSAEVHQLDNHIKRKVDHGDKKGDKEKDEKGDDYYKKDVA